MKEPTLIIVPRWQVFAQGGCQARRHRRTRPGWFAAMNEYVTNRNMFPDVVGTYANACDSIRAILLLSFSYRWRKWWF